MPSKLKLLGEIEEITNTYVNVRIHLDDIVVPTQIPRDIMEQTNIELKPMKFFYWEPSQRNKLIPSEFYPAKDIQRFPTPNPEEIQRMGKEFLESLERGEWEPLESIEVLDDALSYIGTYDKDEVREIAIKRLKRIDVAQVGNRFLDEPPEDVLIPLLKQDTYKGIKEGVLEGWRQVYTELNFPDCTYINPLCRVAELTVAPELEDKIKELLQNAFDNDLYLENTEAMYTILSARRAYPLTEEDSTIVKEFTKYKRFKAIADDMLSKIKGE